MNAGSDILRKRMEMYKLIEDGIKEVRRARIKNLDYVFQKEIKKYKEREKENNKLLKPYEDFHKRMKGVYKSIIEKIKKETQNYEIKEVIKTEEGRFIYDISPENEKLKRYLEDEEEVRELWEKLFNEYEELELNGAKLDMKILEYDLNRMKSLEEYKKFGIKKLEEYTLISEHNLFEDIEKAYNNLLLKLSYVNFKTYEENPKILQELYEEYKSILDKGHKISKHLNRYSSEMKKEFKRHELSAKRRSETLKKGQEKLKDMIVKADIKLNNYESELEEKEKEYRKLNWLERKVTKFLKNHLKI